MVEKLSSIVLVFSLALNLAFVGVWGYHRFYVRPRISRWSDDHEFRGPDRPDWDGEDDRRKWRKGPHLEEKLELDRKQREAVGKARHELAVRMKKGMMEVQQRREELFELLMRPKIERQRVEAALKELNEARGHLTRATVEHMMELKDVLTDEQQRRLFKMIQEKSAGHGRALREFVGGRDKDPRPRPERGGGTRRRRRGAPPVEGDSHGPQKPGRQR